MQLNPKSASGDRRAPASDSGTFSGAQVCRQGKECQPEKSEYCGDLTGTNYLRADVKQASLRRMLGADTEPGSFGSYKK
jgi:hypothetical protein